MADRIAEIAARAAADKEILRAAGSNSDDWDDDTWAAWFRTAERIHGASGNKVDRLRDELTKARQEIAELRTKLATAERQNRELDRSLDEVIGERDNYHDIADELAYAVAPIEVIGEHSSHNCPWENALDLITPMAEVDQLRQDVAEYEKALSPDGAKS